MANRSFLLCQRPLARTRPHIHSFSPVRTDGGFSRSSVPSGRNLQPDFGQKCTFLRHYFCRTACAIELLPSVLSALTRKAAHYKLRFSRVAATPPRGKETEQKVSKSEVFCSFAAPSLSK
ncbi:expressed unknown protein [Ectocarpus siliculosus]|uniref:Uncharacterized protein n=1 Tax=Ectocarpus siliculosus TaxID=2880 RepID=D8LG32_ECTSI|nr:expressed unknown protein [Ectocarpus siliculosus]|eukprot:CBN78931.1 expressed unknown protein [Ectocarpus siliculosus]